MSTEFYIGCEHQTGFCYCVIDGEAYGFITDVRRAKHETPADFLKHVTNRLEEGVPYIHYPIGEVEAIKVEDTSKWPE